MYEELICVSVSYTHLDVYKRQAFVVPIATPTNVIPYATGRMKLSDFVKGGSVLLVIAWILMPVLLYPLASFLIPQL